MPMLICKGGLVIRQKQEKGEKVKEIGSDLVLAQLTIIHAGPVLVLF